MQKTTEMTEKEIIIKHIKDSQNFEEVAKKCGFSRRTLFYRMKELKITSDFGRGRRGGSRKVAKLG
jgi:DNA-binding NtrC family response regulator